MKTKQLISLLISATCLVSLSNVNVFADDYSLGDINNDSVINASDSSDILNDYANFSSGKGHIFNESQLLVADVNNDGEVNASDSSSVLSYYAYTSSGGEKDLKSFLETGANDDVPEIKIDPNIVGVWCLKPQSSSIPMAYKYTDFGEVFCMFMLEINIDENNLIISSDTVCPYTFDGNTFLSQYADKTLLEMQKCDEKNELNGKYIMKSGEIYDIINETISTVEDSPKYAIIEGNDFYFETKSADFNTQNGNFITSNSIASYTVSDNVLIFSNTDGTTSYRYRMNDNAKNLKNCYQIANVTSEIYEIDKNIEMYSEHIKTSKNNIERYNQCIESNSNIIEQYKSDLEIANNNGDIESANNIQASINTYTEVVKSYQLLLEIESQELNEYQSKLNQNIAKKSTLTDQLNFLKN